MIKAFHNYSIMERLSGGYTQWKKTYPDGEWAALVLPDKKLTRQMVEEAFKEQEYCATEERAAAYCEDCYET